MTGLPAWTAPTTIASLTFDNRATDIGYFLTGGTERNSGIPHREPESSESC